METHKINRADDTQLTAYRWPARGGARAVVLIVHGMAEHALRYAAFAEQLTASGLDVYAFDLRGHGATTEAVDHGHLGTNTRWQTLIDDVEAVRMLATETTGVLPTILFGHSLGSFIAQTVMHTRARNYAGVILSGAAKPSRLMCRLGALLAAAEAVRVDPTGRSAILRSMTFGAYEKALKKRLGSRRTRFDWLSSDPQAVDAYIEDPQAGFDMRTGSWQCLLPGIARTQSPQARRKTPATLPLLIAAGNDDPMGRFGREPRALARAYENNGQQDITLKLYDGARHELIHDTAADSFTQDVLAWLAARGLADAPSVHTGRHATCND